MKTVRIFYDIFPGLEGVLSLSEQTNIKNGMPIKLLYTSLSQVAARRYLTMMRDGATKSYLGSGRGRGWAGAREYEIKPLCDAPPFLTLFIPEPHPMLQSTVTLC